MCTFCVLWGHCRMKGGGGGGGGGGVEEVVY